MASYYSMQAVLAFLCVTVLCSLQLVFSSASAVSMCVQEPQMFVYSIQSQCPRSFSPNPPLLVDGNFIERLLTTRRSGYTSVLFYASWCPFSLRMVSKFQLLSSMFPQVEHLMLEQSSALPSVFSKYGIHSLPSMLLINETSRLHYRGPKDLDSLVQFYLKITGYESVGYFAETQPTLGSDEKLFVQSLFSSSLKEISRKEPYLVFSVLFLCLRVILFVFPEVLCRLKGLWTSHASHLRLEVFGERGQTMARVLHMIDVRRIWTKLRLFKTRNFHEGARSARAWTSLASVFLGKSSARPSSS